MKKILIIHHSGLIGGAGISALDLCETLKENYNVILYAPLKPHDFYKLALTKNIPIKTYSFKIGSIPYFNGGHESLNLHFIVKYLLTFLNRKFWEYIIKKENPDLVLVNTKILCWMIDIFKKYNLKTICYVRETQPNKNRYLENFIRCKLEQFTSVFFITEYDKKNESLKKTKSIVIPDYIEPNKYDLNIDKKNACDMLGLEENKYFVLFIGGVNYLKGFDLIVKTSKLIENKNINFIVAGYAFDDYKIKNIKELITHLRSWKNLFFRKKMKKYIEKNNIKNIKFIGLQKNVNIAYKACDLLVIPMNKAHQARPAFEIAAQKKTFIISNFEQIKEYCKDGVNCLMFEPGNEKDLAEKINYLYNNPDVAKSLGVKNYQLMLDKHTKEHSDKLLFNAIDNLLYE